MEIEQFVAQSKGEWRSMRSAHSLAFQQFEDVISKISIKLLSTDDRKVRDLIRANSSYKHLPISPFLIHWEADTDWEVNTASQVNSGTCILVPMPLSEHSGLMLRSLGYTEATKAVSTYEFLSDGTFSMKTEYDNSLVEEKIWFISTHVRCRSSVIRTSKGSGVLQTSFASEVRNINT